MFSAFEIIVLLIPLCFGMWIVVQSHRRSALEVVEDLAELDPDQLLNSEQSTGRKDFSTYRFDDELGRAGLIEAKERRAYRIKAKLVPTWICFASLFFYMLLSRSMGASLFAIACLGYCLGYLISRANLRKMQADYIRSIEYFLPLVMERLVMAVQAGLDIVPAIDSILSIQDEGSSNTVDTPDPVTRLLKIVHKLTSCGIRFEKVLTHVAESVDCSALRHAFMHLALSYKEGGELVPALKELSDSTQLYFQESTEEEIARMPVRATLPLVCTFAGLVICFMTPPLLQVLSMMKQALPN